MSATPHSARSFVTQSFATVFQAATNDGRVGYKLGSSSGKLLYILAYRSRHRIGRTISFVLKKFNLELTRTKVALKI